MSRSCQSRRTAERRGRRRTASTVSWAAASSTGSTAAWRVHATSSGRVDVSSPLHVARQLSTSHAYRPTAAIQPYSTYTAPHMTWLATVSVRLCSHTNVCSWTVYSSRLTTKPVVNEKDAGEATEKTRLRDLSRSVRMTQMLILSAGRTQPATVA